MLKHSIAAVLAAVVTLGLSGTARAGTCATDMVATSAGPVCGVAETTPGRERTEVFRGIPYAEPVSGAARWSPPRAKAPWRQPLVADSFAPACPQSGTDGPGAEDCLFLNVWRPKGTAAAAKLPVMVFIHGGGFYSGATSDPLYNGARLAENGVVVVSIAYRLGVFGFLALGDAAGNFGLMDQQLALRWVRDNAAAFGGDPARVTVFGESAGAISIGLHLDHMPSSRPLFDRAIMESNLLGVPIRTLSEARGLGSQYATTLGCADLECLRQVDAATLVAKSDAFRGQAAMQDPGLAQVDVWAPAIDDTLVRARAETSRKPTIIGYNGAEGVLFTAPFAGAMTADFYRQWLAALYGDKAARIAAAYPPPPSGDASGQATRVFQDSVFACPAGAAARGARRGYLYEFTHAPSFNMIPLPLCAGKPCHTYELPFVFGNADLLTLADGSKASFTAAERELSAAMRGLWTGFAATGQPARWPLATTGKAMVFGDAARAGTATAGHCRLWR